MFSEAFTCIAVLCSGLDGSPPTSLMKSRRSTIAGEVCVPEIADKFVCRHSMLVASLRQS